MADINREPVGGGRPPATKKTRGREWRQKRDRASSWAVRKATSKRYCPSTK